MEENKFLTPKENEAYINDLNDVVHSTLKSVIKLADKFNVDRDNAIQHFATLIHTMSQIATFQHWEGVDP